MYSLNNPYGVTNQGYPNFYYDDLIYTEVTESPYIEISGVIGSFGGTLGLFLGLSLLSLFEILGIILNIFFCAFDSC